jgi:3-oxoacyl-[acyl-carrier-protein] synthase-3
MVETSDEWITTRTGIKERRVAADGEACSDLALAAARAAMEMSGTEPRDLDGIILGTVTGDMQFPATAALVQDRLGASNAAAFDLSAACSGFIYGVNLAHGMIVSGQMKRVVVIGAEVLTKFVDWTDRATCVLFGDGAGAVVMEGCPAGEGIVASYMKSDGSLAELLCIPAGGSRHPFDASTIGERSQFIKMKGDGVFKWAVRAMADAARACLDAGECRVDDLALFIPHQANIRIIDAVVERLEIPKEKVVVNLDRFGNTSSATIPTAYDEAVRAGRLKRGDRVVFAGFGGGFTWGSVLFKHSI